MVRRRGSICRRRERAAYKKSVEGLSSKPGRSAKLLQSYAYLGRTLGSPPGLPGGGITGMLPAPALGAGACIWGSTLEGGHSTPSDFANRSPSGAWLCPVVVPSGVILPCAV